MSEVCTAPAPDAQETQSPTSPPIVCQPWCEYGDGHTNEHPTDQHCSAGYNELELTRMEPKQAAPGRDWYRQYLTTGLEADPFSEPSVFLHSGSTDSELRLTPAEAESLRDRLSALLELLAVRS